MHRQAFAKQFPILVGYANETYMNHATDKISVQTRVPPPMNTGTHTNNRQNIIVNAHHNNDHTHTTGFQKGGQGDAWGKLIIYCKEPPTKTVGYSKRRIHTQRARLIHRKEQVLTLGVGTTLFLAAFRRTGDISWGNRCKMMFGNRYISVRLLIP